MPTIHGGSAANEIPDNLAAAMNRRFANDITSDGDQAAAAAMEMFADGDGTVAPEGSDTSSASVYRVKIAGQEVDLTGDQIENMVALANWAASLDRNVAQQMYAVETGQAVTLPRDEYLRLQSLQEAAAQGGPGGRHPPRRSGRRCPRLHRTASCGERAVAAAAAAARSGGGGVLPAAGVGASVVV